MSMPGRKRMRFAWLAAASIAPCATACIEPQPTEIELQRIRLAHRTELRLRPDPADLRDEARLIIARMRAGLTVTARPSPGGLGEVMLPPTIRVWRRSLGGSDSCSGQVDVIELERYVKGVLPHEWIVSWEMESLKAGSLAIRSYAASWVAQGGKYDCADLCDTTYSQVYEDQTDPKTDQAVDATAGKVLVEGSAIVFAEYSAENGNPTKTGVSDPVCAGKAVNGHGRGMCQWGSQRWAQQGKDHEWIALHYYPGSALHDTSAPPPPDGGSPADAGPADGPSADRTIVAQQDLGAWSPVEAGARFGHGGLIGSCQLAASRWPPGWCWPLCLLGLWRWRRRPSCRRGRQAERQ